MSETKQLSIAPKDHIDLDNEQIKQDLEVLKKNIEQEQKEKEKFVMMKEFLADWLAVTLLPEILALPELKDFTDQPLYEMLTMLGIDPLKEAVSKIFDWWIAWTLALGFIKKKLTSPESQAMIVRLEALHKKINSQKTYAWLVIVWQELGIDFSSVDQKNNNSADKSFDQLWYAQQVERFVTGLLWVNVSSVVDLDWSIPWSWLLIQAGKSCGMFVKPQIIDATFCQQYAQKNVDKKNLQSGDWVIFSHQGNKKIVCVKEKKEDVFVFIDINGQQKAMKYDDTYESYRPYYNKIYLDTRA